MDAQMSPVSRSDLVRSEGEYIFESDPIRLFGAMCDGRSAAFIFSAFVLCDI